jgi:tRNA dimethylallyltransferase
VLPLIIIMEHGTGVLFLIGPTAVGKTAAAIELAGKLGGEIISADSMQVYRGLDVLSAKPSVPERERIRHHLVDVVDAGVIFDVVTYAGLATAAIADIQARGLTPIIVGGSGMYVRALVDGIFDGPGRDEDMRRKLETEAAEKGLASLYERLKGVDPGAAQGIHPHDKKKIIRALEVFAKGRKTLSSLQREWKGQSGTAAGSGIFFSRNLDCAVALVGLTRERGDLKKRIEERVERMFENGAVEEVRGLLKRGLRRECTIWQSLGLKEIRGYLEGVYTLEETKEMIKKKTRAFAKRQFTWFKKDTRIRWLLLRKNEDSATVAGRVKCYMESLGRWKAGGSDRS